MGCLDPEAEDLLKEILENDKDFPKILRDKFGVYQKTVNGYLVQEEEDTRLRAKIKVLIDGGYISKLQWGDNVPYSGRVEQKGRSYFIMKEQEETIDFNSLERLLYKLLKVANRSGDIVSVNYIALDADDRITFKKLEDMGLVTNVRHIGTEAVGFDFPYGALHYFENRNSESIKNKTTQKERVFISHSSKDEEFVIKLSQFFEMLGIDRNDIFCSSIEGQGVKHGKKIEEAVRNEIIEDKVLVFVITNNFIKSEYCLNELGAGWILADERTQNKHLFHIKLPDIKFDEIRGFIGSGDKCTELNEKSMTTFVEELEDTLGISGKKATKYRNLVDNFINDTKAFADAAVDASKLGKEAKKKKEIENLKKILRKTNEPERKIIRQVYKSSSGEATFNPTSATIKALEYKQILFSAAEYYDYFNPRSSYTFHPWVYEVLKEDEQLKAEIIG